MRVPWLLLLGVVLAGVVSALGSLEHELVVLHERTGPDAGSGSPRRRPNRV
ncbi:hypothetical protein [Streptomyces sp. NPDC002550]